MKFLIFTALLFLLTVPVSGQQPTKALTYFDYGDYQLKPAAQDTLDHVLAQIKSKDLLQITLYGHTDSDGSEDYNKKLSQYRVESVRAYLVAHGVPNDLIKDRSYGERQPTASNEGEVGKQKNRRVEISIQYKDDTAPVKAPKISNSNASSKQTFIIPPTTEKLIKGRMGTVIKFPTNVFVDNKGKPITNDITIELIEVYTKADMVLHHLHTMSGQRLLESAGMVNIKALSQGVEVMLKEGSRYTIEFPAKNEQPGMQIFYGDTIAGNLDWQTTRAELESAREELRMNRRDPVHGEEEAELDRYVFNGTKLGWINCDRFLNKVETFDLVVNIPNMPGVSYCLVFKSMNSVMSAWYEKESIQFRNVPVGAQATVVGLKKTDTAIYYTSQAVTLRRRQPVTLSLQKLTESEFKERVKELN